MRSKARWIFPSSRLTRSDRVTRGTRFRLSVTAPLVEPLPSGSWCGPNKNPSRTHRSQFDTNAYSEVRFDRSDGRASYPTQPVATLVAHRFLAEPSAMDDTIMPSVRATRHFALPCQSHPNADAPATPLLVSAAGPPRRPDRWDQVRLTVAHRPRNRQRNSKARIPFTPRCTLSSRGRNTPENSHKHSRALAANSVLGSLATAVPLATDTSFERQQRRYRTPNGQDDAA